MEKGGPGLPKNTAQDVSEVVRFCQRSKRKAALPTVGVSKKNED